MTAPVLTKALTSLRSGFNVRFPTRDKTTDGWIGDAAHQLHVSGHNPDDTAGSLSEYTDTDTIPEVRAIDVDKDLRDPNVTMQMVIDRILKTPNDTRRLKYIIFNGRIWSKSNDWVSKEYTGTNQHTEHGHFSGDPAYDEDATAWSVQTIGAAVSDFTQTDRNIQWATTSRAYTLLANEPVAEFQIGTEATKRREPNNLRAQLDRIEAQVKLNGASLSNLLSRPVSASADVDENAIASAVAAAVIAALKPELDQIARDAVRAELNATRLTAG